MAGNIKGITIELNGNATNLNKALREVDKNTGAVDKKLRQVNNALKFNPTSVDLWRQKQELLNKKVEETKTRLNALKQAQAQMDADGVDKNSEEYKNLQREIITTESKLKTFQAQLRQVGNVNLRAASEQFKQWGSSLESAGQKMRGLSIAAAGVVAALGTISYKAGQSADDINTLSKVTGIGTADLQKYSYAADLVDTSVESIAKSNKRLVRNAYEAANGNKTAQESFSALGVSVTDAEGNLRDSDAIFQDVISSLGQMTNETERDAIAQRLMGKAAADLNPLIEDGGETYKRVSDTLKKYNLDFVDQETLNKANEFNDEIDTIKVLGSVAFAQIGSALASNLAPVLEKVVDLVGRFASWLGNLDPAVLTVIGSIAAVVAVIAPILMILGKLAFAISSIMNLVAVIGPAIGALAGPIGIAVAVIAGLVVAGIALYKNWDKIKAFAKSLWKSIKTTFNGIKTAITTVFESVKETVSTVWNAIKTVIITIINAVVQRVRSQLLLIKTVFTTTLNAIKTIVTTIFNGIKTVITTVLNFIKSTVQKAWSGIKTVTTTIWNGIKTAVTSPINAAKNAVSSAISSIKSRVTGGFKGISSSVSSAFNAVKSAITKPINTAWSLVSKAISKIRGLFPLRLGKIFSGIKLPHFKISGGKIPWGIGGKGTAPKVDVQWYAKGGIFTKPTVAGIGEAGPEGVIPLDKFWAKLDKMAEAMNNQPAPTEAGPITIVVQLDGREVARTTAPYMESEINKIQNRANRKLGFTG